jgi:hypothetical protein
MVRNNTQHFSHFSNWRVAELDGDVVGAINTCLLQPPLAALQPLSEGLRGLNELKAIATGTCCLRLRFTQNTGDAGSVRH